MKSQQVISMLSSKHSKDVFFVEVAMDYGRRRMDAWVLIPSYTKSLTIGYEVKVSRSDFLNDKKMQDYLPYCNQMYLVAPKDVVKEEEIPEGFGYILATENRLITKRKAPVRDVIIPETFYRGLLCNRLKNEDMRMTEAEKELERRVLKLASFSDYLEGKKTLRDIGEKVSHQLNKDLRKFERDKRELEDREDSLNSERENWNKFRNHLSDSLGSYMERVLKYGNFEVGIDNLNDIFIKYNHPEKELLGIISNVEESFRRIKEILKDDVSGQIEG